MSDCKPQFLDKKTSLQAQSEHFLLPSEFSCVEMQQVHGAETSIVAADGDHCVLGVDALVTTQPKTALIVRTADCLPILIYHPQSLIAVAHAGRQGTELGITRKLLQILKQDFGIYDSLKIWFGPAICKKCYQIDRESDQHYDLAAENTAQVRAVFTETQATLTVSDICTACHNDRYFSYRRDNCETKRNFSVITLW